MSNKPVGVGYKTLTHRRASFILFTMAFALFFSQGMGRQGKASKDIKANKDAGSKSGPQMVFVKGGHFIMGNNNRGEADERPEHKVSLDDFWMARYEVTVGEFRKFMDTHTYVTDAEKQGFSYCYDGKNLIYQKNSVNWECDVLGNKRVNEDNHPVIHVSNNDAEAYCKWLSKQTGKTYRLPTEAEWEYAARGGVHNDTFEYSGGVNMEELGWYAWNSDFATHPVGEKKPNSLGICDMSGNAWEWCSDRYAPYTEQEQTNPKGSDTGTQEVMRGGGWRYYAKSCRTTTRRRMPFGFNGSGPGFRVVYSAK